jgi:hypothetical protein
LQRSPAILLAIGGGEESSMQSWNPTAASKEAALNWLALGLLLAAWNSVDDAGSTPPRPEPLRGYPYVTVRAMTRIGTAPDDR